MPIDTKISATTYQNMNGSNMSTAGIESSINVGQGKLSVYGGIGTNFTNNSTGAIIDFKGSIPYGDSPVSGSFRIRNNLNQASESVQFRIQPANVSVPVSENVNLYADPYAALKIDNKGNKNYTAGVFAGTSVKISKNTSIFVEGQLYDVTKVNKNTTGINAGISISL